MTSAPLVAARYATPFGDLAVLTTPEDGAVRSSGFRTLRDALAALPVALQRRGWVEGAQAEVAAAVESWLARDGEALMAVPVAQEGGPFFQDVWAHLRTVPAGATVSYAELAQMAGRPRAMRAAGTACARNAVAPFVPCHRVVRAGGELGSYGFGGAEIKRRMLELEGAALATAAP